MELDELQVLLSDWYNYGRISGTDKQRIKQEAFRVGAVDPEGCKTCPNFWNNVMHNMISYLRQNSVSIMSNQGEYMLPEGTGSMMVPMSSIQIVAEGVTTDFLKVVGDPKNKKFIEDVLKEYPELKEVILKNPNHKAAPTESEEELAAKAAEKEAKAAAAKAEKEAAKAAEKAQKEEAKKARESQTA